jgi:hypothetical protein
LSAVLLLAACRAPRPPPLDPTHSAVHDHTGPSVLTHSGLDPSSAHTGSTGTEGGGWAFSFTPPPPVSPWAVLTGGEDPYLGLILHNLGDTDGDGLDELAVHYRTPYPERDRRFRVVSAALLTGGEQLASAVSVATLPYGDLPSGYVASAGDTDHDGFGDVWLLTSLWRGPLQGDYADDANDIEILGSANNGVIGGFDADGDGWTDMAQSDVSGNLDVYYGPFPEDRYGRYSYDARFEASDNTWIQGAGQYSGGQTRYLGAMNAPEEHLVTSGWNCWDSSCDDARVYDIAGPRDRVIPWDSNLATLPSAAAPDWTLVPMADADGDGLRELLYLGSYRVGRPLPAERRHRRLPGGAAPLHLGLQRRLAPVWRRDGGWPGGRARLLRRLVTDHQRRRAHGILGRGARQRAGDRSALARAGLECGAGVPRRVRGSRTQRHHLRQPRR